MFLGFGLVEDPPCIPERGVRRRFVAPPAIEAAEFEFGIGDPRGFPAGATFENHDRGSKGTARRCGALQRFVGDAEIVQIVGDERMGRPQPALIDRRRLFDQRQRLRCPALAQIKIGQLREAPRRVGSDRKSVV